MPRRHRTATGGYAYHVLNRAVGRATIFETSKDYAAFERVLEEAREQVLMRVLAFCVMPTHWHLVLWPIGDGDLSEYMRWLTNTHTRRWHLAHGTVGTGPVYQGRFKSFPVEEDEHFATVCRYVERNALRADLVARAEGWRWSSLWHRVNRSRLVTLDKWPVPRGRNWIAFVNDPETESELEGVAAFGKTWDAVRYNRLATRDGEATWYTIVVTQSRTPAQEGQTEGLIDINETRPRFLLSAVKCEWLAAADGRRWGVEVACFRYEDGLCSRMVCDEVCFRPSW